MRVIMRLLILLWIAKDMRKKKKKKKLRKKKAMLAKKRRRQKAAIRRKKRAERKKARTLKNILSDSNKAAIKKALPFAAVGAALWLLITEGGARRKNQRSMAMLKSLLD